MTQFLAVSNRSWQGLPPAQGRPCDEQWFADFDSARRWLREKKCGGSISAHVDGDWRIVEEVPPG